jgi:hypothetical protein
MAEHLKSLCWPLMKKQYRTPNVSVGTVKKSMAG